MSTEKRIELEITAVELWFKTFGYPGMSSDEERLHMSNVLLRLKEKLEKIKK